MRHEGEPSVEEILESIKRVIARDNREAHQAERRRRESAGVTFVADADDDGDELDAGEVLDLGEDLIHGDPAAPAADGLTTESAASESRIERAALSVVRRSPAGRSAGSRWMSSSARSSTSPAPSSSSPAGSAMSKAMPALSRRRRST